jgi:outer membrane protein assembly factor BamB
VAGDGTVFVADYGTTSISAIDPNTNEIRWFAGTWNDHTFNGIPADSDTKNFLNIGGLPKLGKIQPTYLTGNSQLNTLYMVDQSHMAVRKISPLFKSSTVPAGRKLEQEVIPSSVDLSKTLTHLRGSA